MENEQNEFESSTFAALMETDQQAKSKPKRRSQDNKIARLQDSKVTNKQDDNNVDLFEYIRSIVKQDNKEASPFRLSVYEKDFLLDVLYGLKKKHKLKSDQTQITRIALIYMLADFKAKGKDSILVKSLERLNA